LNDLFFEQMGVRAPDDVLSVRGSFGEQVGQILSGCERILKEQLPDRLLILGDTNSGLAAIVAKRMAIPVFHMEAGNRCYDDRVPEEVNRRIIDHSSDVLMPYTERSRQNLLREGVPGERIYVTGNPIFEVLQHHREEIDGSQILSQLGIEPRGYFLVTLHRAENVDQEDRLLDFMKALERLHSEYGKSIVVSTHPRTRDRLDQLGSEPASSAGVRWLEPFSFFDFVHLERHAFCVLSDSGTVQEECCIFGVPNVTLRDVTERPETIEVGSNILSGADQESILRCVRTVLDMPSEWTPPREYMMPHVSQTIARILLGLDWPTARETAGH